MGNMINRFFGKADKTDEVKRPENNEFVESLEGEIDISFDEINIEDSDSGRIKSDNELFTRLKDKGNDIDSKKAFEEIYRKNKDAVLKYIYRFNLGDRSKDIVHETMIRLYEKCGEYESLTCTLATFLHTIAKNICLELYKKEKRRAEILKGIADTEFSNYFNQNPYFSDDNKTVSNYVDFSESIKEAIADIAYQDCENVFKMRFLFGFQGEKIAEKLGVKYTTLRNKMSICYNELRIILTQRGYSFPENI